MAENEKETTGVFGRFIGNIETRISNLTTLQIKTVIGDFELDKDGKVNVNAQGLNQVIDSRIDLLQGDITTYISTELVQDRYTWIREFHSQKEMRGHEIIHGNIKAIMALYDLYKQTKRVNFDAENATEAQPGELSAPPKEEIG